MRKAKREIFELKQRLKDNVGHWFQKKKAVVVLSHYFSDFLMKKRAKEKAIKDAEEADTTGWHTVNEKLKMEKMYLQDYRLRNYFIPNYSKVIFIQRFYRAYRAKPVHIPYRNINMFKLANLFVAKMFKFHQSAFTRLSNIVPRVRDMRDRKRKWTAK